MSDIETGYRRDELGNIIGTNVRVKNDVWTYGGAARTDNAQLYVQNRLFKTVVDYTPSGISSTLSGGNDIFSASLGFTPSGPTGSVSGKFGGSTFTIVPDGFTTQYERIFGSNKLTGSYSSPTNTWSLNLFNTSNSRTWGYAITTGYSQSGGFSFFGSIFNLGF